MALYVWPRETDTFSGKIPKLIEVKKQNKTKRPITLKWPRKVKLYLKKKKKKGLESFTTEFQPKYI